MEVVTAATEGYDPFQQLMQANAAIVARPRLTLDNHSLGDRCWVCSSIGITKPHTPWRQHDLNKHRLPIWERNLDLANKTAWGEGNRYPRGIGWMVLCARITNMNQCLKYSCSLKGQEFKCVREA